MGFFSDRTTKKKITLLLGHPNRDATLCSELANVYESAAKSAGHLVERFNIAELEFDPILHKGYKTIQELEPDLKRLQISIKECDHLVIFYPNWWCTMPALLKGLFDRMWLPGFAFNMRKSKQGTPAMGWIMRMKGKSARVFVVSGQHPFFIWLLFGDYTNEIKMGILWFSGLKTKVTHMGPADNAPLWKVDEFRNKVKKMAKLSE